MSRIVLVVEEHPALRRAYARELRQAGYEVLALSPFEDVEAHLAAHASPIVVLDPHAAAGRGLAIAEAAVRAQPSASLVFNISDPHLLESDFSTWMADAYAVRTRASDEVVRAVRRVAPPEGPGAQAGKARSGRPQRRAAAAAGR